MGHLGIIFILPFQNKIFFLEDFAAASCYEKCPFEVANWIHMLELLFHLLKVLPSFRHQIIVKFCLPVLHHKLRENRDLVFIPSTQNSSWPTVGAQYICRKNELMNERKSQAEWGWNITASCTYTASCSFLFKLLPVPSQVPIMDWRCGLMLIYMPRLIVPVFIATTMEPV